MNRFDAALDTIDNQPALIDLAHNFLLSVEEATTENKDPGSDAAVMLLGMQIAFMTHADVGNSALRDQLIAACRMNGVILVPNDRRH